MKSINRNVQDAGFDGLTDLGEASKYHDFAAFADPAADNYQFYLLTSGDLITGYRNYNGFEGNSPVNVTNDNRGNTTFPDVEEAQLRSLIVAMRDLLNLSPDIARSQFARRLLPHNAAQDKRWMLIALQLGDLQRLPAEKTRRFMQAQVEAANFAKRGLFTLWEKEPSKLRLRPQIDTIAENQIGELIQS